MAGITKVLEKEVNGLQVNLAAKKQHFNEQRISMYYPGSDPIKKK